MTDTDYPAGQASPRKRADARRNEQSLLDAAAAVFVVSGVDAPVRDIAAAAGVGMGTIYRHFPTRADLIIAVYRHQVDACAEAGPALLASSSTPHAALTRWADLFVDFLTTKHGLAAALQSGDARFETLHAYFLDRLVPVCAQLLGAAAAAGEIRQDLQAYELLRAIGNLCAGTEGDARYDARGMVGLLLAGLLSGGRATAADEPAGAERGLRIRHAGRVVLLDPDDRVLLMRYDDGPPNGVHWCTPGGGLNPGEDYAAGARRELAEETGWHDVELGGEIFRRTHVMEYADAIVRQVERFFLARTDQPGRAITGVGPMHAADGIAAWRWWTLAELEAADEAIWPAELPGLIRAARQERP